MEEYKITIANSSNIFQNWLAMQPPFKVPINPISYGGQKWPPAVSSKIFQKWLIGLTGTYGPINLAAFTHFAEI